ncbi:MAG: prolipoprotein diacylglyceryl transferase [Candidatus Kapabacteria bacterium]|nr:prolipoprotein diacylglyceryl transferase [Ignavibacteriota bacterium]MCW5886272.1 prolipoprotein diacylglyceryl transferase [Candidatus Kapabacteria bacterium]
MEFLAIINWNVSPEIVSIGPITLRYYGLLFALGFVVGYQIMTGIYKNEGKTIKQLDFLAIVMILSTVIGARLGHCLFYEPEIYLANPIRILYVWEGGLASHGAGIAIILALIYYSKRNKDISALWILDRIVIVVALAGFFIRLGNLFNSEIYGIPTDFAWAFVFERIDNIPRHAVQLYESISYLIIFFVLFFTYKKYKKDLPKGLTFGLFLILVFGVRFILEYFKAFQADFEMDLPLRMGQILSIPFVLTGIFFVWKSKFTKKP